MQKVIPIWFPQIRLAAFLFLLTVLFVSVGKTFAQESDSLDIAMTAEAGFDGQYKNGNWVPVYVSISNNGPPVEDEIRITIGDSFGRNGLSYSIPVNLPTQSNKLLPLAVFLPDLTGELDVELLDDGGRVILTTQTNSLDRLAFNDLLYGVVTSESGKLDLLENIPGDRPNAAVAYLTLPDLPDMPALWNALDVVIFHDVDTTKLTQAQLDALMVWVETGGQVVVVGGPSWQKTTPSLKELLPVSISGSQTVEDIPALREMSHQPFRDPGPYLISTANLRQGEMILNQDELPILASRPVGRGGVTYLALDPNLAPLADWSGSKRLWEAIVSETVQLPLWAAGAQGSFSAGNAVSNLPSLTLPSGWQLFIYLMLYVIIIGPMNYLVLKRYGRRELAWLSIPLLVIIFSGIAFLTGFRLKGNTTILNQMSIAFGQTGNDQLKVQTLLGLYSPRRDTYDLALPPHTIGRPFDIDGGALSGIGNLQSVVQQSDNVTLEGVRIDVSDVETFVADGYRPAPAILGQTTLQFDDDELVLAVMVQNNSDVTLENAVMIFGFTAVPLGDLSPGVVVEKIHPISPAQEPISTRPAGGPSVSIMPSSPTASPININYDKLLGSQDFYNDRKLYPRWQLLQAISPEYSSTPAWFPQSTPTLVGWTDESQLSLDLAGSDFESAATTLYFLELPLEQNIASGTDVTISEALLDWRVVGESGVFNPTVHNLYLPPGWIAFEFQPWVEFQRMPISDLSILLRHATGGSSQPLPGVQVWDWIEDGWVSLNDAQWGETKLQNADHFIGPGNLFRLRLQNNGPVGIDIEHVFPIMSGDMD